MIKPVLPLNSDRLLETSPALAIAVCGYRYLPRGKGAFARTVGRFMVGDRFVRAPTPHGFSLVSSGSTLDMVAWLQVHQAWDDHVLAACLENCRQGGTFYDIGANLGYIALSIANRRSKGLAVLAFEPNPELAAAVALAVQSNGLAVSVFDTALDQASGEVDFFIPSHAIHASFESRERGARHLKVPTVRLDDLVLSGALPAPTVMKIDVEGAEMRVINGAESTLQKYKPTLVYECDANSGRFGHTPADMEVRLLGLGYREVRRLQDDRGAFTNDYMARA
jgi:FkbM family methyltransferase